MSSTGPRSLVAAARRVVETRERHIIDTLIQERAPGLLSTPVLGALGRAVLYPLLGYREAVRVADEMGRRSGLEAMRFLSRDLRLDLTVEGLEHVPRTGSVIVVANHPTGIADGSVIFDAITRVREDLMVYVNRDAIRIAPGLADIMIPVDWVADQRTRSRSRETLTLTQKAIRDERLLMIFPSGRLAYVKPGEKQLRERPWLSTPVSLARRHGIPVIPMHIDGRNSGLFYLFSRISDQLRDITLFHEVVNKRSGSYVVRFGPPIPPERLEGDAEALTVQLQAHVESGFVAPAP